MIKKKYKYDENIYNVWAISSIVISIVIAYASFLKISENRMYAIGVAVSIAIFILGIDFYIKKRKIKNIKELREQWGKELKRKREFSNIKKLYDTCKEDDKFYIDDQTWFDLDMDRVFEKIDRTLSTPGEQYLYHMLREVSFNEKELSKRGENIKCFREKSETREEIQLYLSKLGRDKKATLIEFLNGSLKYSKVLKVLLSITSLAALLIVIYTTTKSKSEGILLIFVIYAINYFIHSKTKKIIGADTSAIRYMSKLLKVADNICSCKNIDEESLEIRKLKEEVKKCSKLMKNSISFTASSTDGVDVVFEYINIFFLMETRAFLSAIKEIQKNAESIKNIYMIVGKIDALISIASYRESLDSYIEPVFVKGCKELVLEGVVHPLIEKPIDNSIDIKRNIIITGSNMSGKSTFLRTVGVNVLLAQTIYTCTCSKYEGDFFRLMTSISVSDNITTGTSYYMGEAEALYRIIKSTDMKNYSILTLIDEIFRGTNPVERINASAEILEHLSKHNSIVLVATHDLEITKMVKDLYDPYYFTENVSNEGLNFDYKVKKGVSSTRNAVKILEYMGYPKEIIDNINIRIENNKK